MDIQQKLDIIQQIHREQAENERYFYQNDSKEKENKISRLASFRFRLLVSVLLFLCFFVIDKKEITYGEIKASRIINHIESNIEIEDFIVYFENLFENSDE